MRLLLRVLPRTLSFETNTQTSTIPYYGCAHKTTNYILLLHYTTYLPQGNQIVEHLHYDFEILWTRQSMVSRFYQGLGNVLLGMIDSSFLVYSKDVWKEMSKCIALTMHQSCTRLIHSDAALPSAIDPSYICSSHPCMEDPTKITFFFVPKQHSDI